MHHEDSIPIERADPDLRAAQAFPSLTSAQIQAIRPYGKETEVPSGTAIYRRGDREIDFYVVLDGAVEVFEVDPCGKWHSLHTHTAGGFLGEINLFNRRKSLVSTQTSAASRLLRVGRLDFRRMLTAEPELARVILRAAVLRRTSFLRLGLSGTTVIGDPQNSDTLRIRRFLTANDYPFRFLSPNARDPEGRPVLEKLGLEPADLPAVWDTGQRILKNPCLTDLAYELGLLEEPANGQVYDLLVIGGGPAGLAASVYAGSEGLDTLVIESWAPGGQAGTSSQIENYLGFPNGISGWELAGRAQMQAQKFGVQLAIPRTVKDITRDAGEIFRVKMDDGRAVTARSVVVASGAKYRKLGLAGYERFEGRGVQYAATAMESQLCSGQEVVVVGGGNSAGQAAVYLSQSCAQVHVLVRGKSLASSMSQYLIARLEAAPKIHIYFETEVVKLLGNRSLEQVQWRRNTDGKLWVKPIRTLFVMIGAVPNTDWLARCVQLDRQGFVVTGFGESPYGTSVPGIFAIGDVRAGSVKRVASAVGEGSVVVSWVHQYLGGLNQYREKRRTA